MRNWVAILIVAGCQSSGGLSAGPAHVLAAGYAVDGVTDDGKLVVRDKNHQVSTVGLGGGTLTPIGPADSDAVWHNVVFLFTNPDAAFQKGTISTWTSSGGLHKLADNMQYQTPWLSSDGQWLVYFDNLSADGKLADMVSARVDGSGRQVLETQIPVVDCFPWAESLGTAWVLSYCKNFDPMTFMGDGELERFDPAANQRTKLLTAQTTQPFATLDKGEQHVFATDSNGEAQLFDSAGHGTPVDSNVATGYFAPDGSVVYLTFLNELKRWQGSTSSTLATLSPANGFVLFDELSPDGKTALLSMDFAQQPPYGEDLWAISAVSPSSPRAVLPTTTGAPGSYVNGSFSSFTRDSTRILYLDPQNADFSGSLHVAPAQGGTPTLLGDNVVYALTTHDAQLVYCANQDTAAHDCDLYAADGAKPDKKTKLAAHAGVYRQFLTPDGKHLVYSVKSGADEGVWVIPTP
jgi:hypothetical protein